MTTEELVKKREELLEKQRHIKGVVGDVFETTDGLLCTVWKVECARRFVRFEDGFEISTKLYNLHRGICKNRRFHKVWGVGINEKGKHASQVDGVGTKLYDLWTAMLSRCYGSAKTPAYADCTVDSRFHYFQEFADWCVSQVGYENNFTLDKDILLKNNKIYSPDTCAFVPLEVNSFFAKSKRTRGSSPIGVHWAESKERYVAQINQDGKRVWLGQYKTPEEAFEKYRAEKQRQLNTLIQRYQDVLSDKVIEAMLNYKVEITD